MTKKTEHKGPLSGIKVVDFGHYYAGPMAAMLLADQGATVIRIVGPGQPELQEQQYRLLNRNKRLLTLDLKTEEGKTQALSLIDCADVVIENFRPRVMKRLGLDYASLKDRNPGLVYLSLPGFASTDKERAHIQAWEGVMGAAAGVFTDTSAFRNYLSFPPVYTWVPQCSIYGGMNGVIAIMAALISRDKHGLGTQIEVPLVDIALTGFFIQVYQKFPFGSLRAATDPDAELPDFLKPIVFSSEDSRAVQEKKLETARQTWMKSSACDRRTYLCRDGREIFIWSNWFQKFADYFVKTLGVDKQLLKEGFINAGPWVKDLDNNIADGEGLSAKRKERLIQIIGDILLTKNAEEWETILAKAGVPVSLIRTREEWLALTPMLESGVFSRMDNGDSSLIVPGRLVDVSGPGGTLVTDCQEAKTIEVSEAKKLFKHNPQFSVNEGKLNALSPQNKTDLLSGLKVLDLTNVAAGPMSGYVLAQYGADVIKADPPVSPNPGLVSASVVLNQGKRSILTDVTTAPGREVFERLLKWADVVLHNSLDDTAKRLGVTHQQIQTINPKAVSCQISAYGGTHRGGWESRTGFDNLLQAASGLMAQYGTLEQPHWHGLVSCGDTMGGFGLAFTALLGIYQQRKTGFVGEGRTSLARVINYAQLPFMIAENGRSDWGEARGQFAMGEQWWQRLYACNDGWIYVGTTTACANLLTQAVIGNDIAGDLVLEKAFVEHDCTHWLAILEKANIACHRVLSVDDICDREARQVSNEAADERANGAGEVLRWEDHPCGTPIILLASDQVRINENYSWLRPKVAPRLGENTREILHELRYSAEEIEELIHINVAYEYLPVLGSRAVYFFDQVRSNNDDE